MTRWMRLFLRLLVFAALTAGGIWLGQQVMTDPGYVLFALGGYAIDVILDLSDLSDCRDCVVLDREWSSVADRPITCCVMAGIWVCASRSRRSACR